MNGSFFALLFGYASALLLTIAASHEVRERIPALGSENACAK
jgi:hypothetical protein